MISKAYNASLLFFTVGFCLLSMPFALATEMNDRSQNYTAQREQMVKAQLEANGIFDQAVLRAMGNVPRHLFVPEDLRKYAYADGPLPIGYDVTISQPYIVALMTQSAKLLSDDRVLEVGAGSGYQAAVLGQLVKEVYAIEIIKPLAELAEDRLKEMGYANVHVKYGDGYLGWKEHAPYDAIFITAAASEIPPPLIEQLKMGGRLLLPLQEKNGQRLVSLKKTSKGLIEEFSLPVRFVPLTRLP